MRTRPGIVASLALLCAAGCSSGPATGTVVGKVTVAGRPLDEGVVTFTPVTGGIPVTAAVRDGQYRAEGVPAGEVLAAVTSFPEEPAGFDEVIKKRALEGGVAPPPPAARNRVPDRYGDPGTSGLTVVVKDRAEGETTFDIPLSGR